MTTDLIAMGKAAKKASRALAILNSQQKNAALLAIADEIESQASKILAQNKLDIEDGRAKGLSDAILDRLVHNAYRVELNGPSMRKAKAKKQEHTSHDPHPAQAPVAP